MGSSESSQGGRKVSFGLDEREQVRVLHGIKNAIILRSISKLAGLVIVEFQINTQYEQEQALVQEELLRLAKREREAAGETLSTALQRERNSTNEERKRAAQLAVELQGREAELKRQEAFYKEQLARIERKNAEIYKLTSEQYQEAATKAEEWIKRRNTDPVCASLQSEILKCYQENQHEVLKCSELAKEYQRCVSAAQKDEVEDAVLGVSNLEKEPVGLK
ncbi:hypothetical protein ASZ78_012789 [Callipepla squamata]|uniref:CHCH domain-containing protein n=1 Tax=Callipepla squamata TaxID=9009 RepID=A0A226NA83_CALSU|nr:hypothetical protein ASZ78_012789 [Callipepla squamata]